jgi:hypothetical protein
MAAVGSVKAHQPTGAGQDERARLRRALPDPLALPRVYLKISSKLLHRMPTIHL